jgi:threonine dehydrogenase-like Zn-dependent dehydrogenase
MAWYFELLGRGALAAPPLVTHRFPLARWREALLATHSQGRSGAVKVVFDFGEGA